MGLEQENIDSIEPSAVDAGLRGQIQHGIEIDAGFGSGAAFAYQARPHSIVQFGKRIARLRIHTIYRFGSSEELSEEIQPKQPENSPHHRWTGPADFFA